MLNSTSDMTKLQTSSDLFGRGDDELMQARVVPDVRVQVTKEASDHRKKEKDAEMLFDNDD